MRFFSEIEFGILGPVQVLRGGVPVRIEAPRQRAVLAILLLEANRVVSVDHIAGRLWGDELPPRARNTIQSLVLRLRQVLPEGVLATHQPGYLIRVGSGRLDLDRFRQHLGVGAAALAAGDARAAGERLGAALALWRGEPFEDAAGVGLAEVDVPHLRELRLRATEDLIEAQLMLGGHREVIPQLARMSAESPTRERPCSLLMLALYRSGRQAEALAAFRRLRELLIDELGIEPTGAVQRLHRQILSQDPMLDRHERRETIMS